MRYCCVPLCKSQTGILGKKSDGPKISFHALPKEPKLQKQFALRIRRDIGPNFRVTRRTIICSKHYKVEDFYSYNPPSGRRLLRPGVLPSMFDFKPSPKPRKLPANRRSLTENILGDEVLGVNEQGKPVDSNYECSSQLEPSPQESLETSESQTVQTDDSFNLATPDIQISPEPHQPNTERTVDELLLLLEDMKREKESLMYDVSKERIARFRAENENKFLKVSLEVVRRDLSLAQREIVKLKSCEMSFDAIKENQSLMKLYTGMESQDEFEALFGYLDPGENGENIIQWRGPQSTNLNALPKTRGRPPAMKGVDQLLLVFCRLRLNLLERDLAHRFGVSLSTVSRVFASWINFMYFRLGCLQLWPSKEYIQKTMPEEFRKSYPSTRVIIDATEIRCQNPSSFTLKTGLYSFYKGTNTFKGLVGISPNGLVTFVSALFSGSISDEEISKRSGILDQDYEDGDGIMADKGFNIEKILPKGVSLNMPPFKRGDRQFTRSEVKTTQEIASLRVQVERRIGRIKTFRILSQVFPQSLIGLANQIWTVCCILSNFQSPLNNETEDPLENVVYFSDDE